MDIKNNLFIHLICYFIFTTLIYGQGRINSRNSKFLKRRVLSLGGFFSKEVAEEVIRIVYLIIILGLFLVYLFINKALIIRNVFMEISATNFVIILISFIAFIQILFLIITILHLGFLKININDGFKNIDWLKVNLNQFFYTGYIKTLFVAIFEVTFFFDFMFTMLSEKFKFSLTLSMLITILYYCYGKFILRKNKSKCLILISLGFSMSLTTLSLINAVNSLFVGVLFMYVILIMIAFKDIKVRF